jgi:UDP-N-acetylmuramoylalanine--D-glutamate ligase
VFEGHTFIVIGLGTSGVGALKLLLNRGAKVVALDEKADAKAPFEHPNLTVKTGPFPARFWEGAEAVVVSPGVPLAKAELVAAKAAGATLFGEVELGWRCLPKGAGPILGVTGTNGKSTTTALLGELVKQYAPNTFVGGNLGTAFTLAYEDPQRAPYDFHVVELSSFQLEGLVETQVKGAAILNLQPDHLDRYATMADYGRAKARIFANQPNDGFAVVNADDPAVVELARAAHVPVYAFTLDAKRTSAGFEGLAVGSSSKFMLMFAGNDVFTLRNRALRGPHNVQNAMAAAMLARLAGVPAEAIQRGLDVFTGLPHRLESVGEVNGVEYVNDSKSTNVASAVVALKAFAGNVWLIAGGKGKGAPYAPLVQAARDVVKGVLTIGQDAPAIAEAFAGVCAVHGCGTLEAAVGKAHGLATKGDVVLLSPACASYDQFQNFEHRGDTFKNLVRRL